eukprot:Sspe_Gene.87344::Locus_58513_Transcript_1_1_Confidence_1.000_Length_2718::g.87344::m.87344
MQDSQYQPHQMGDVAEACPPGIPIHPLLLQVSRVWHLQRLQQQLQASPGPLLRPPQPQADANPPQPLVSPQPQQQPKEMKNGKSKAHPPSEQGESVPKAVRTSAVKPWGARVPFPSPVVQLFTGAEGFATREYLQSVGSRVQIQGAEVAVPHGPKHQEALRVVEAERDMLLRMVMRATRVPANQCGLWWGLGTKLAKCTGSPCPPQWWPCPRSSLRRLTNASRTRWCRRSATSAVSKGCACGALTASR